jgi:3-oxoacyl-[acyl-carrier protein] reductase
MIDYGLRDRVVMVTGAADGIGRRCAEVLLAQGARVAALDVSPCTPPPELSAADRYVAHRLDVADRAATVEAIRASEAALGPLAGVIACAGTARSSAALDMTDDAWDYVLDVNLKGTFVTCVEAARAMATRLRGSIVTLASVDGMGGHAARANYSASKFGVVGLTQTLAIEWGALGIRVNALAPNVVETARVVAALPEAFRRDVVVDRTPLGRLGTVDDVAAAALFLLSDAAAYITGVVLPVDGGLTAGPFTARSGRDLQLPRRS